MDNIIAALTIGTLLVIVCRWISHGNYRTPSRDLGAGLIYRALNIYRNEDYALHITAMCKMYNPDFYRTVRTQSWDMEVLCDTVNEWYQDYSNQCKDKDVVRWERDIAKARHIGRNVSYMDLPCHELVALYSYRIRGLKGLRLSD